MEDLDYQKYMEILGLNPVRRLGDGGLCAVYQALDKEGSPVTVKFGESDFRLGYDHVTAENKALDRIAERAGDIDGIARKRSFHELENGDLKLVALVKDYIPGENLVDHGLPNWRDLGDAVKALHKNGIARLDINPRNVVVDPTGKPYLVDLGFCVFKEEVSWWNFMCYKIKDSRKLRSLRTARPKNDPLAYLMKEAHKEEDFGY
jgi:serine/threonine protein kinase